MIKQVENLIFAAQVNPQPKITEYVMYVPEDLRRIIEDEIRKKHAPDQCEPLDFEISKIKVRVFGK